MYIYFSLIPVSISFILAFDMSSDANQALEQLIELGFERLLTSGQESSALEGLPILHHLIQKVQKLPCKLY